MNLTCAMDFLRKSFQKERSLSKLMHSAGDASNGLLDEQSDACFIKETALERLGINGPEIQLKLSTVLAQEAITSQKITGLVVRGVNESTEISLPRTYTRHFTPARRSQIPRPETARK